MNQKYDIKFIEVIGNIFSNAKKINFSDLEKNKSTYKTKSKSYSNYPIYKQKTPAVIIVDKKNKKQLKHNNYFYLINKNISQNNFTIANNENLHLMLNKDESLGIFANYIYCNLINQIALQKTYKNNCFEINCMSQCVKEEVIQFSHDKHHRNSITFFKTIEEGVPLISLKQNQTITTYAENIIAFELNTNFVAGLSFANRGFKLISSSRKRIFKIHLCDRYKFIKIENKNKTIIITGKK